MTESKKTYTIQATLNYQELQVLTGYTRRSDVERCLERQGVRFFSGRKGPFTIVSALNHAIGVPDNPSSEQKNIIEF
ncbi:MAG: hypothetical protein RPU59_07785 [Candidatus Sedimenticola sp. (ex Thyasira tokunagai)]